MATLGNSYIQNLIPETYDGSRDLEDFIKECDRFFEVTKVEQEAKPILIKAFIQKELLPLYEKIDKKIETYEERLRKAFEKPTNLIQDFMKLYHYQKNNDDAEVYFTKIEAMVKKLMKHKWDEFQLTAYFLVHCVNDKDIKREIKMKEAVEPKEIKEIISKVDNVNKEEENDCAAFRKTTYANVVARNRDYNSGYQLRQSTERNSRKENYSKNEQNGSNYFQKNQSFKNRKVICYNCGEEGHFKRQCLSRSLKCFRCNKEGHISQNCKTKFNIYCYSCKDEGHRRKECPYIKCNYCGRNGHFGYQCFIRRNSEFGRHKLNAFQDDNLGNNQDHLTDDTMYGRRHQLNETTEESDPENGHVPPFRGSEGTQ